MSYHWDVSLEIECSSEEESEKLFAYMKENNVEDNCLQFKTNDFSIVCDDVESFEYESNFFIGGESKWREIGCDNIYDFFAEIEDIGKKANVSIKNIKLTYLSQESDGFYVYVKSLSQEAFDKFIKEYVDDDFYRADFNDEEVKSEYTKEERKARKKYKNVAWMIWCEPEGVDELAKNDPDGRESLWEFEEELNVWTRRIISEWKFPWDEGCRSLWAGAIDKDGEFLWENS